MEILISLVVLSLGLLGVASLQVKSLRSNQDAYHYSQAAFLAYDIAERMRANPTAGNNYATVMTSSASSSADCEGETCSAQKMASWDLEQWISDIAENLPSGAGKITYSAGTPVTAEIIVRWFGITDGNCDATGAAGNSYSCFNITIELP